MKTNWPVGMAHRIGLSGAIAFTPAKVGLTLHVPCERGKRIVDFDVKPNLHPDHVAKLMLAKGWTFGTKLACPECGRTRKNKPKEETPMDTKPAAANDAAPSDAAKKAHRLVMMMLEEGYDEVKGQYRAGYSDASIAGETGSAEAHVRKTREEYFGPLGEPDEIAILRADLAGVRVEFERAQQDFDKRIGEIRGKIASLCKANGWAVPV